METLRTSSYMIPVKLDSEEGKYILIHGYTGAIDIVTENLLNQIKHIETENTLSEETLHTLQKRGYITNKTEEQEYTYVKRIVKALHQSRMLLNNNYTWVVTYNCNFRCPYCFENRQRKDGQTYLTLSKEQIDNIYSNIKNLSSPKTPNSKIMTLYGGEPLLKQNFEIVNYIVEEGQKRGYKFKAITNGYDLDAFADLLSPNAIYQLQITMDGTKYIHNQRRIHYQGYETFDKIIHNIKIALNKDVEVIIRMNTDENNVKELAKLKNFFSQNGFSSNSKFSIYSAFLRDNESISFMEHKHIDFISAKSFITKHEENHVLELCNDYGLSNVFYKAMTESKSFIFRPMFCLAQGGGYVFAPFNKIYPCWEVVGNDNEIIGTYQKNNIIWNSKTVEKWRSIDVSKNLKCSHCRYALFCGGGCPAQTATEHNKYCIFLRKIFDKSINRAYARYYSNNINN